MTLINDIHCAGRFGLIWGSLLLLALAVSACAPKRVVKGKVESAPRTESQAPSDTDSAVGGELQMPKPQVRGKVVLAPPETPANPTETLQLGIQAATLAREQLDKPYQWGGSGPEKFDCSGLVYYVFGSLDVSLPRVSRDQAKVGSPVKRSELQPGDLVFFITSGKNINHVGIYTGDSRFIHAPRRYSPVRYDSLNNSWWRQRFQFGRRING